MEHIYQWYKPSMRVKSVEDAPRWQPSSLQAFIIVIIWEHVLLSFISCNRSSKNQTVFLVWTKWSDEFYFLISITREVTGTVSWERFVSFPSYYHLCFKNYMGFSYQFSSFFYRKERSMAGSTELTKQEREAKPQMKIGHYILRETLGVGTFGKVKG